MTLEEYNKKRNFKNTPEPGGNVANSDKKIYVIQKHQATHLHYDLRLEIDNVLKSWAIPKEPPTKGGIKRLAVQVEDHPTDYADFEGIIPKGQYGAGKVEIWDKGSFNFIEKKEDKLIVDIKGKKLNGTYCLIRLKKPGNEKNWLFFKVKSETNE